MIFSTSRVLRPVAAILALSFVAAEAQAAPVVATKRTTLNHSTNTSAFFTLSVDGTSSFTGEDGWAPTAPTQGAVATSVTTKKSFSIVGDSTALGNWTDGNRIPAGITLAFDAELTIKALPAPGSYLTMPGANSSVGAASRGIGVTQTAGPTGINDINVGSGLEMSAVTVSNVNFSGTMTETGFTFTPGGVANFGTTVFRSNVFQEANHGMVLTPLNDPTQTIGFGLGTGTVASGLKIENNFGTADSTGSSVFARQTGPYTLMVTQGAGGIKGLALEYDVTYDVSASGGGVNADFNGDSVVDGADFLIWQQNSGLASGGTREQGDADGDGVIGALDLEAWKTTYGGGAATAAVAAVPEPTVALMASILLMSATALRKRR